MGFYTGSFLELLKRQPFFFKGFARGFKVGNLFFNSFKFLFQPFLADSCKRNKSVLAHRDLSLVHSNIKKIINRSQVTEKKNLDIFIFNPLTAMHVAFLHQTFDPSTPSIPEAVHPLGPSLSGTAAGSAHLKMLI